MSSFHFSTGKNEEFPNFFHPKIMKFVVCLSSLVLSFLDLTFLKSGFYLVTQLEWLFQLRFFSPLAVGGFESMLGIFLLRAVWLLLQVIVNDVSAWFLLLEINKMIWE